MIPKIIHHIWLEGRPMPARVLRNMRSWRDLHPDWEHHFWNQCRLPYLRNFQLFMLEEIPLSERFEIVRMALLEQFGGIAHTPWTECLKPWDQIAATMEVTAVRGDPQPNVLGCLKNHPFALEANDMLLSWSGNLKNRETSTTGRLRDFFIELLGPAENSADVNEAAKLKSQMVRQHSEAQETSLAIEPENLVIAVQTVSRQPEYIHQTLASMFSSDPLVTQTGEVFLMVGSDHAEYLRNYLQHEHLRVLPMRREEARVQEPLRRQQKFSVNRARCLRIPLEGKLGVLVVEDDVVFKDGFLKRLLLTIREMEVGYGLRDYVLALFACYDFESDPRAYRGRRFCSYSQPFFGTQAMYFPRVTAEPIADYLEEHGVRNFRQPGDLLIKEIMAGKIYATVRPLAQHIGEVSTGLGGTAMEQICFHRPYREFAREEWGQPDLSSFPSFVDTHGPLIPPLAEKEFVDRCLQNLAERVSEESTKGKKK